jgi:hypothetical protein
LKDNTQRKIVTISREELCHMSKDNLRCKACLEAGGSNPKTLQRDKVCSAAREK